MDPLSVLRDHTIRDDLDNIVRVNDYMNSTIPLSIPTVPFIDREPLLDHLLGRHSPSSSTAALRPFDPSNDDLEDDLMEWTTNDKVTRFAYPSKFDGITLTSLDEITLRPFDLSDVEDLLEWTTDDNVTRFCLFDTYTSKEQAVDFIKNVAIPHPWMRAICLRNRAIGSISVTPGSGIGVGRGEIGYALASKYWGKGIVTRAVEMVVSSMFSEWPHLVRLEALVDMENLGSQRVMEKVGFHREGVLRKYAFIKGRFRDVVMFSLVRFGVP